MSTAKTSRNKGVDKPGKSSKKKSRTETGSASAPKTYVDNWKKVARAAGKDKKYVDIYLHPLLNAANAAGAHVPSYAVPWNPAHSQTPGEVNAGIIVPNLIPQGNTIMSRKDNSIKLRSLYIKGMFRHPYNVGAAGTNTRELCGNEWVAAADAVDIVCTSGLIRVAVVYDENPNAVAPPTVNSMFKAIFGLDGVGNQSKYVVPATSNGNLQVTSSLSDTPTSTAFQNMRGQGRFRLLADEYIPYGGWTIQANGTFPNNYLDPATPIVIPYSRYLKLGGIGTHFASSSDTMDVSSIVKGGLYVICTYCTGNGTIAGVNPVFEGNMRLRFDDQ